MVINCDKHSTPIGRFIFYFDQFASLCWKIHTHLSSTSPRSDKILLRLMKHLDQLTSFELLQGDRITDTSIQQLRHHCPKLTILKLTKALISEEWIYGLSHQYQQLTTLQLHNCPGLTGNIFSVLVHMSCLKVLDLKVLPLTRTDWAKTNDDNNNNETKTLVEQAIQLTHLVEFRIDGAPAGFARRLLSKLASKTTWDHDCVWPHLERLLLGDFNGTVGDDEVIPLIKSRPELLELSLSGTKMTDTTLDAMAQFFYEIEKVGLLNNQQISSRGVRRLAQQCPSLGYVGLEGCGLFPYQFPEADCHGYDLAELTQNAINNIRLRSNSAPGEYILVGPNVWMNNLAFYV